MNRLFLAVACLALVAACEAGQYEYVRNAPYLDLPCEIELEQPEVVKLRNSLAQIVKGRDMDAEPAELMKGIKQFLAESDPQKENYDWNTFSVLDDGTDQCPKWFLANLRLMVGQLNDAEVHGKFKNLLQYYLPRKFAKCSALEEKKYLQGVYPGTKKMLESLSNILKASGGFKKSASHDKFYAYLKHLDFPSGVSNFNMAMVAKAVDDGEYIKLRYQPTAQRLTSIMDDDCDTFHRGRDIFLTLNLGGALEDGAVPIKSDVLLEANEINRLCQLWYQPEIREATIKAFKEQEEKAPKENWYSKLKGKCFGC